ELAAWQMPGEEEEEEDEEEEEEEEEKENQDVHAMCLHREEEIVDIQGLLDSSVLRIDNVVLTSVSLMPESATIVVERNEIQDKNPGNQSTENL
ncbi:hypothetical protein lerEdw1_016746, partial [Lerista edwardsae]